MEIVSAPTVFRINQLPLELLPKIFVLWADVDSDAPWMAVLASY